MILCAGTMANKIGAERIDNGSTVVGKLSALGVSIVLERDFNAGWQVYAYG